MQLDVPPNNPAGAAYWQVQVFVVPVKRKRSLSLSIHVKLFAAVVVVVVTSRRYSRAWVGCQKISGPLQQIWQEE